MMYKLPKVPYTMEKDQLAEIPFRGINYSDMIKDGDVADSFGISMRRYPFVTNKKGRTQVRSEAACVASYNGKLLYIKDGKLYYDEDSFPAEYGKKWEAKSYAAINSKVVIMPDKKYIEFEGETPVVRSLEAELIASEVNFTKNSIDVGYKEVFDHIHGGWFSSENNNMSFSKNSAKTIKKDCPTYVGDNIIAQVDTLICDVTKSGNDLTVCEEEYNKLKEKDFNNVAIIFVDKNDNTVPRRGTYTIIPETGEGETEDPESGDINTDEGENETETEEPEDPDTGEGETEDPESGETDVGDGETEIPEDTVTEEKKYLLKFSVTNGENTEEVIIDLVDGSYDIYVFVASDNDDYLKLGDEFEFESKNYKVSSLEGCIQIDGDFGKGRLLYSVELTLKADIEPFGTYLKINDQIKFEGIDGMDDVFTITKVEDDKIAFSSEQSTPDPTIPNTTRIRIWKSIDTNVFADFKEGDAVTVSGCSSKEIDLEDNNRTFVIDKIRAGSIFASADIFIECKGQSNITISRKIPDLDYICESGNRLWGCSIAENTIYVSAQGDPTNMYAYEGISTDSFATAVGSPGSFTGCCRYGTSVLFFKEDKIHKILGSYPGDYTLYSYDVEGVQAGSEKSTVVINEILYFKGVHGIYAYDGSVPTLISKCFGEKIFSGAVAGTDGISYYVSLKDDKGDYFLFSYNTQVGIWTLEDKGLATKDALRIGMELYFLDTSGDLWRENAVADVSQSEWMIQFTPFYETIQGKKIYSRILIRATLPQRSYMTIEMRCDGGRWTELGKIVGKNEGVVPIRIPVNRCDKFEIRLSGKGEFILQNMMREFYISKE